MKPDEKMQAKALKTKIQMYKQHFAKETENVDTRNLDELSIEELEEKLYQIKVHINNADPSSLITMMYYTGMTLTEQLSVFTPLKLEGLSIATSNNPGIRKALTELEIEYADYNVVPSPEKKLLILTLQNMYNVHKYNTNVQFKEAIDKAAQQVQAGVSEQFVDI
jgi:hypothetical protein